MLELVFGYCDLVLSCCACAASAHAMLHCPLPDAANRSLHCRRGLAHLLSVSAGHIVAAQVAASAASEAFDLPRTPDPLDERILATALPLAAGVLLDAVQPALLAPLERLLKRERQVCTPQGAKGDEGCFGC